MVFEYPIAGPEAYVASPCVPFNNGTIRLTTKDGVEYVQTPESAFEGLAEAGYPWPPNYVTVDGMRMHYIDVGASPDDSNEVVLLLHGQPSWSFLYRKMVPVLTHGNSSVRVLALDWLGMGRSDKPTDLAQHTYLKQVERLKSFIRQVVPEALEEPTITLFVQDWGSLIGLRTVGDEPSWFRRVISANGNLPVFPSNVQNPMNVPEVVNFNCSDDRTFMDHIQQRQSNTPCGLDRTCFSLWIDYALTNPTFKPSDVLNVASSQNISASEIVFYDRPFPFRDHTAAIRTFPSMIAAVQEPEFGNARAWESLQAFPRPFLALAGEDDPNLGSPQTQNNLINNILGATVHDFEHRRYSQAGHFIQEDVGEELAAYVMEFITGTQDIVLVQEEQKNATTITTGTSAAVMTTKNPLWPVVFFMFLMLMRLR